jgi:Ca-activated chloride channel family protein
MKAFNLTTVIAKVSAMIFLLCSCVLCQSTAVHAQQKAAGGSVRKTETPSQIPDRNTEEQVVVNTDLISLVVTVTDNQGRFVPGLQKSAFSVFDEKRAQEIAYFADDDAPASVAIVFDCSGSMSGEKIRRSIEALSHFFQTSHTDDEYFFIGFNDKAQLLVDRTRDTEKILDKLTYVNTSGQTAFYDAVYAGVQKVMRGTHRKRAVLVISDGQDNDSRYTYSELRRMLKESDVIIYSIGIEGAGIGSRNYAGGAVLEEIAAVSGGKAFFPKGPLELDDVFEQIALELRHQYAIAYKPTNFAADGTWHKIKIKVEPPSRLPHLFVRSKEGYFALANSQ